MTPSKNSKPVIIVMGPPGSGKGTQGELLSERFGLHHFETSEIIEKNLANAKKGDFVKVGDKKYFLSEEKKLRDSGKWMSPPLVSFWVENKIKELADEGKGIVISGSPKTLYEAEELLPLFKKLYGIENIKVVSIQQDLEVSIWRNSHRRICELMRHSVLYNKETIRLKNCPFDGSKLMVREDTKPEIVKSKFNEYQERSLPVLNYFKNQKLNVKKIDGSLPPSIVFRNILKALSLK